MQEQDTKDTGWLLYATAAHQRGGLGAEERAKPRLQGCSGLKWLKSKVLGQFFSLRLTVGMREHQKH